MIAAPRQREVHRRLSDGDRELHRWIESYDLEPYRPPASG